MEYRLLNKTLPEFKGVYIFLDNNYLSFITSRVEALEDCIEIFSKGFMTIDPFVRIEFLRDTLDLSLIKGKEQILSLDKIFQPMIESNQTLKDTLENKIIWLTRIYKHIKANCSPSFIDLVLACRSVTYQESIIVTSNIKDFPPKIFTKIGILSYGRDDSAEIKNLQ